MSKPKLLLIDDQYEIRISGKYALDKWYEIITAESGTEAVNLLENSQFDIIILDIVCPSEKDGLDTLKIIRTNHPNIPVIMCSGSLTWRQKWDELRRIGASGYITKPFDRESARDLIDRCLRGEI